MLTMMTRRPVPRLTICAVLAIRDEAPYLRFLLPALAAQDIDVAVIDNDSTDGSLALYRRFAGRPVIAVTHLAYRGVASLSDRLEAKQQLFARCPHDWLVHHDADEILEHGTAGRTLRAAIEDAEAAGHTALNFEEFVFLPEPGADYTDRDYYSLMSRYYFHEPYKHRLNRAWRNAPGVSNLTSGGHRIEGPELRFAPEDHVLRHYIVLSQEHAWQKYLRRRYDPRDIERGWQGNRLNFTRENLTIPERHPSLLTLHDPPVGEFSRACPTPRHFWKWGG